MGGAGLSYSLKAIGGEAKHRLTIAEMPSHNHRTGETINNPLSSSGDWGLAGSGYHTGYYTTYTGGDQPHENRPPFYAVYYIIKIKK